MFHGKGLHNDESGQTALETAIILIAFVVVASVFAFTILSAGQASTDSSQQAIYSGLQGVQSSMEVKGAVIATESGANVVFSLALASGGDPIDLTVPPNNRVVIGYRDGTTDNLVSDVQDWTATFVGAEVGTTNAMLEVGELAEINVTLPAELLANQNFTLEVKPPTGAVLLINRTAPAALTEVMELR